ncbi:MAG TPA: DUF6600 domain-containing protein [Vicinamibacterales bacterium]|jgi:hypothetical protein
MSGRLYLAPALAAFISLVPAASVRPQEATVPSDTEAAAPAHIAFVDGSATLERDGRPETELLNMPLMSGDRLRTSDGRVEVLFGDGSALYVDARTTVDVQSDELLRLMDGRVRVAIVGPVRTVSYRIDSPAGAVGITEPGDYRLALLHGDRETQLELAVLRGTADIFTDQGSTPVRAGQRAYASAGLAPSFTYAFNSAALDDFDRWTETRRDVQFGVSAQYLPSEVQQYAPVLDAEGDWRYDQSYGNVWYPHVSAGWRPYYYGRWISYPQYGWTWVGADHFGWPTHHYGRWGFSAGAWFWIPGRRWAPAWVSWAYAPGYVSWCPLGFDNRAVFALNVSVGRPYYSSYYSPWNYWTVVAAPHFGYGYVNRRVIQVDRVFAAQSRPVFVTRSSAPAFREAAIPRGAAPIRWAGARAGVSSGVAVSRSTVVPAGRGDTYFSRESNRAEHAVPRNTQTPLPASSGQRQAAPARSGGGSAQGTAAPRAVPRSGGSVPMYQSRSTTGVPGNNGVRSTVPETAVPRGAPTNGAAGPARDRLGHETRPMYTTTPSPSMSTEPRRAQPPAAAPSAGQPIPRGRPQADYAPRAYERGMAAPRVQSAQPRATAPGTQNVPSPSRENAPRAYERPSRVVPRAESPQPRASAPPRVESVQPRAYAPRAESAQPRPYAAPRVESAPQRQYAPRIERAPAREDAAPRIERREAPPPQRSSAPERAAPREAPKQAPSHGSSSPRRGRGGA